jgi:hypothetical protein
MPGNDLEAELQERIASTAKNPMPLREVFSLEETLGAARLKALQESFAALNSRLRTETPMEKSRGPKERELFEAFREAVNRLSLDNDSNTPDAVLAALAVEAVYTYIWAVRMRDVFPPPKVGTL